MESKTEDAGYGLIFPQEGRPQRFLAMYIDMVLNYRYGCRSQTAEITKISALLKENAGRIAAVVFVQSQKFPSNKPLVTISQNGAIPVFLVIPAALMPYHVDLCKDMQGIYLCSWEKAFGYDEDGIQELLAKALSETDLNGVCMGLENKSYEEVQQHVAQRLKGMNTLPTLPK